MTRVDRFDVLVVGSGMMGAAVARCIRDARPAATIAMVAGGPSIGSMTGQHLHDVADPAVWARYNAKVASGIQGFYAGVAPSAEAGATLRGREPGMIHLSSLGEDAAGMPAAAVAWNAGGMGVHWTAATPAPWGAEVPDLVDPEQWADDLARAAGLLRVNDDPYPPTAAGTAVTRILRDRFDAVSAEGRGPKAMPMAINDDGTGLRVRTSPSVIFPPIGAPRADTRFHLVTDALATSIVHADGRATGVVCRSIDTGEELRVDADHVIVCADAIRTPQLLFASGIRPEALGRYLNEHVFLTGLVLADPERVGFEPAGLQPPTDHEWASDCLWVPHSGEAQPFQVHVMTSTMIDDEGSPLAYGVGLEYYIPTEVRRENRLRFSDDAVDAAGLPRITVEFALTEADRRRVERARREQADLARRIGDFDPATESAVLPAGSSLHFTGTVRMGAADDGTSVCDVDGRVWGFENLHVAGTGVVPTALVCNATLTGMTTAVRAAAAVAARLDAPCAEEAAAGG